MAKTAKFSDLRRLKQGEVATLLGVKASWVRDQPAIPRNGDRSYDAAEVVRWAATQYKPARLSDSDFEKAMQFADLVAGCLSHSLPSTCQWLETVQSVHGCSGLAAVAAVLVDTLQEWISDFGAEHFQIGRTEVDDAAYDAGRVTVCCQDCGRRRHGRTWSKRGRPTGFVDSLGECPDCRLARNGEL